MVEVNPSFDKGKLRIAYTGKNRNNTFISKEAFEKSIPTMFNCPVVTHYDRQKDTLCGHDSELVTDGEGTLDLVPITQPVGFVPESAEWQWEVVEDDSGIHQYLVTDVLLWKRQEAYKKIKDEGIVGQSMEVTVLDGEMKDDYYQINNFIFTAFCLLGTAEPCFESAALFTFSNDEEQKQFREECSQMMCDFKKSFAKASDKMEKEGKEVLNFEELLKKYDLTESDIDFEYKDMTDEELEAKFAEVFGETEKEPEVEPEVEPPAEPEPEVETVEETEPVGAFALASDVESALRKQIFDCAICENEWGKYPQYYFVDYDAELCEVYYEDTDDCWCLYGASYVIDGDSITVDFETAKRKKFAIIDYVEGEEDPMGFALNEYVDVLNKRANAKYDALNETCIALNAKVEAVETAKKEAAVEEMLGSFEEKLNDCSEYQELKANAGDYELDVLEDKLYALVGKQQVEFSLKDQTKSKVGIVLEKLEKNEKPYGDLFEGIQH